MNAMAGSATPATTQLGRTATPFTVHTYEHDPRSTAFGDEAVAALESAGAAPDQVFKTLVVALTGAPTRFGVAIVPVLRSLSLKAAARALGAGKAAMAPRADAERVTGYVFGGVSPFGQRTRLPTVLDASALSFGRIFVSGGRRGLELEIAPTDLVTVLDATTAPLTAT
ncbi:hypothetical protein Rrhod_3153 [Rhodococcus rhodnii LMG 5362]|uniref:Cys-tRNA(Pro)/Cys-tRNA(Cys) deacylase n=2 Tax=Rhodococcus rhodnii TaxID=38312 RepID=R7WJC4_9NOCA|nr:hypothetical protein Rrhod_3153 [Rhodococcus rhodnii LMG 5362]